MEYLTFLEADRLHLYSSEIIINRHLVKHHEFKRFCLLLRKFERMLEEDLKDDFWRSTIRLLRRYRFDLSAAPVPFNDPLIYTLQIREQINQTISKSKVLYPEFVHSFREIADSIRTLVDSGANPILEVLRNLVSDKSNDVTGLLLKETRLIKPSEKVIEKEALKHIRLVNVHQLKGREYYGRIVILGPVRWYPKYVSYAPRAKKIDIICYEWIMDKWNHEPSFVTSFTGKEKDKNKFEKETALIGDYSIGSDELLPEINWDEISPEFSYDTTDDAFGNGQEIADAKLLLLEGNAAVFIDKETSVLVIDLEEDTGDNNEGETQVKRIRSKDIWPGVYILLRTSGSGEYIVPIANRILGGLANDARKSLQCWKNRLREIVGFKGLQNAVVELITLGSHHANEVNVRNWMSMSSIKPRDYRDFEAIIKLIQMEKKTKEFWTFAEAIDEAHKRAGFHIRKLLLKQVYTADLTELVRKGKMDFELDREDGGTLTAFRVNDISPEEYKVPVAKIGCPFERKDSNNG